MTDSPELKSNSESPVAGRILSASLSRSLVWVLFFLHALVLLAFVIKIRPWLTGDSGRYLALANALISGNGFGLGSGAAFEPEGMRMPGYSALIAVCYTVFGSNAFVVVMVQCILFLVSVWLVWKVATALFGQLTGIVFLALSAVYPFVAYSACQISPEMPAIFLTALVFFLLVQPTWARCAGAGAAIAIASYFRPNLLLLGVVLAITCVLADRRLYAKALLLLLTSGALVVPWATHNYKTFGVFTPVTVFQGTGLSLFLATWQSKVSVPSLVEYGMRGQVTPELARSGMLEQVRALNLRIGIPPETVFVTMETAPDNEKKAVANQFLMHTALANMRAWPATYLRSCAINILRMWFTAHLPESWPTVIRLCLILQGVLIFLLGLTGTVLAVRHAQAEQRLIVFAATGAFLYFTFTLCWLHTEARYTIPVRLVLLMFAAYGTTRLLDLRSLVVNRKRRATSGATTQLFRGTLRGNVN